MMYGINLKKKDIQKYILKKTICSKIEIRLSRNTEVFLFLLRVVYEMLFLKVNYENFSMNIIYNFLELVLFDIVLI